MEKIIEELRHHESQLQSEVDELTNQMHRASTKLEQVRSALTALTGKNRGSTKTANAVRKTLSDSEIEEQMLQMLKEKGPISLDMLMRTLEGRLLAMGLSKVGIKSKVGRLVSSSRFRTAPDGMVSLVNVKA